MSRLINQPIEIAGRLPGIAGLPERFVWRGQAFVVGELLDTWADAGSWWDGEPEVVFFRLTVDDGMVVEILRNSQGSWRLYRIYD